ncbi:MAG TPA: LysR substrate-binding domain-containing protein, partial [Coleofasciculaceae cyanobacterium]
AGVGVAILPDSVQKLQRQGVVYRTLQDMPLIRQIAVVWRRTDLKDLLKPASADSILLRQFLRVVQAATEKESLSRQ